MHYNLNRAKCHTCNEFKDHINSGEITKLGTLVYMGARGTPWLELRRVKTCPDCIDIRLGNEGKPPQPIITCLLKWDGKPRICECGRVMSVRRHRICEFCQPVLPCDNNVYCEDPE